MIRKAIILSLLATSLPAAAQDLVVMRRVISKDRMEEAPSKMRGAWVYGDWMWSDAKAACGNVPQARTATCVANGKPVDDARCTSARDALTRTEKRTDGCSYSWVPKEYGNWDNTCSASSTRTVSYSCIREDGVPEPNVTRCGTAAPARESAKVVTSCDWKLGTWSASGCGTYTRTRDVSCINRVGGLAADVALCTAAAAAGVIVSKPGTSETVSDTSGCGYSFAPVTRSDWSNGCFAGSTRTTTYECRRSDGQVETDQVCTSNGAVKPSGIETKSDSTGCSLSNGGFENGLTNWNVTNWGETPYESATVSAIGYKGKSLVFTRRADAQYNSINLNANHSFTFKPLTVYTLSLACRADGPDLRVLADNLYQNAGCTSSWSTRTFTFTSSKAGATRDLIVLYAEKYSGTLYIDDVSIQEK